MQLTQGSLLPAMYPDRQHDWRPEPPPSLDGITDIRLDFETTGLRWWDGDRPVGAAVAVPDGRRWYLPWGHHGGNLDEATCRRWFEREVRDKRITNINAPFDNNIAHVWGVDLEAQGCTWHDVAHDVALLDDHRHQRGQHPFSLESIAQDFLGEGKLSARIDIHNMADHHAAEVAAYAMRDVDLVDRLVPVLRKQIIAEELEKVAALEDDVIFVVCEMERNAAPLDVELLRRERAELETAYVNIIRHVYDETGVRVNPNSSDDLSKLFRRLGIEITALTATGKPSFTEQVLDDVALATGNEIIEYVIDARKLDSLKDKYYDKYDATVGPDRLLRYALHQLRADEGGTVSGRFSSSAKTGTYPNGKRWKVGANIQQVPAVEKQRAQTGDRFLVRRLFRAATGQKLVSFDAAQIELRIFAHYLKDPKIIEAYRRDPHTNFHKLVHKFLTEFNPDILYKVVKNTNFAFTYGAGPDKLALTAGITRSAVDALLRLYDTVIPGASALIRRASHVAETRGFVKTLLGRRSRFPDQQRLHKALNGIIQGGAADLLKMKLVEVHRARKKTGFLMRYTVHDELVGDVPDEESARLVLEILDTQSVGLRVPILWEMGVGDTWADCA
jgi:DNA polymerase I-like protein with 3'-5' exonuclease and polymerase domains